jgi:hypothetical protein
MPYPGIPAGEYAITAYAPTKTLNVIEKPGPVLVASCPWAPGDRVRLAVESGIVRFYVNGSLVYTWLRAPIFPMFGYVQLYFEGSHIWGDINHDAPALALTGRYDRSISLIGQSTERRFNP